MLLEKTCPISLIVEVVIWISTTSAVAACLRNRTSVTWLASVLTVVRGITPGSLTAVRVQLLARQPG